jgi:hypothetical protein
MQTRYRIVGPVGEEREDGQADVEVAGGALVLAPSAGSVLRVPFGHISSVTEPEPFTVRITLADGNAVELSRLGVMRTQLLAELRDARADDVASASGVVGEAAVFGALSGGAPAEIRVYDDALLVIGPEGSERISFSFVGAIQARDYMVSLEVSGRAPVTLSRLGRRTDELNALLTERLREARGRTSAFLGSLLPGLDPMVLREAAGLLRDGVAVPARTLDGLHADLARTLIEIAALPARRDAAASLARQTELALGFKQLASVRLPAAGVTPWQDHAAGPHVGEHDSPGGSFRPGLMGMMAAGVMSGGPFGFGEGYGAYGDYWAFRALGAGMNPRQGRPMTPRPDVTRGRLTPATEDLSALTASGNDPTVLAFALGGRPGLVVYEVLNQPEPVTFGYRVDGADALAAVNRALDDAGFRPAAVRTGGPAVQIPHDAHWPDRMAGLLAGSFLFLGRTERGSRGRPAIRQSVTARPRRPSADRSRPAWPPGRR